MPLILSPRPPARRHPFLTALLISSSGLAASCSSGSDSGTNIPAAGTGDPTGVWNFFRDGQSCEGEEFAALSMEIVGDLSTGYFVNLGDPVDPFSFEATLEDGLLEVTGTDTVGGTTLSINSASWTLSSDGNVLQGAMETVRTEGGVPCPIQDVVTAFRADETIESIAAGPWEWSATVISETGGCNELNSRELLPVQLYPQRDGRFVFEVTTENGSSLQFEASFDGTNLLLSGSDLDSDGNLATLGSSSMVTLDPAGGTGTGILEVGLGSTCSFTFLIDAIRPSEGRCYLPYIEDMTGEQSIVGVDPAAPATPVELVQSIGDPAYGLGPSILTIRSFTARSSRRTYDADSREVLDTQSETLYYRVGNDLMERDLAVRLDAAGAPVEQESKLIYDGSGEELFSVAARSDLSGATDIVTFTEGVERRFLEISRAGEVRGGLVTGGGGVVSLFQDERGDYRALVVFDSTSGDLMLQSVDGGVSSIATGVLAVVPGNDGSVYFTRPSRVDVFNGATGQVEEIRDLFGAEHFLGRPVGGRMVFSEEINGSFRMMFTRPTGGMTQLAATGDISINGAAPSRPLIVGDQVLTRIRADNEEIALIAAPLAGGSFRTLLVGAAADEFSTGTQVRRFGDRAYFNTVAGANFNLAALDPSASSPVQEELVAHEAIQLFGTGAYSLAEGSQPDSLVVRDNAGSDQNVLRVLDRVSNPMGLLSAIQTVFEPAAAGGTTYLEMSGRVGLVADYSSGTTADPATEMHFFDLDNPGGNVALPATPGEFSLAIQ